MSRLGETIRAARVAAGMTEKQLGRKCGMAETVIKSIEAGTRIASDDQARQILKILGKDNPVSTELEVAAEPEVKLRPRPRAYVLPTEPEPEPETVTVHAEAASDAWLDALSGVVKRVPVSGPDGLVIDHVLLPIQGGKIEGASPDKVSFFRCPDDSIRGFRIYAGDLLLTVPADRPVDGELMLVLLNGLRTVRKMKKLDGQNYMLQTFDREFESVSLPITEIRVLGKCVKLVRSL